MNKNFYDTAAMMTSCTPNAQRGHQLRPYRGNLGRAEERQAALGGHTAGGHVAGGVRRRQKRFFELSRTAKVKDLILIN